MPVYDFTAYAKRRAEQRLAGAVTEELAKVEKPGALLRLKEHVTAWITYKKTA